MTTHGIDVTGVDASDFNATLPVMTNANFFTHKATEGIKTVHVQYGPRLNAMRNAGIEVLGSYHVVRTPSAANGSLQAQLDHWFSYMDQQTPWWRTHPHFMLQIDAERWAYDNVAPEVVKQFASLVVQQGVSFVVTYASHGQYGDTLQGIPTALWNADYTSGSTYPGDDWQPSHGTWQGGWAPYSGQTPMFLQWTSRPYDTNTFRGTLDELKNIVARGGVPKGDTMSMVAQGPDGQFYVCDGTWSRPIDSAALGDLLYLANQGLVTLATGTPGPEWGLGGKVRLGWSEAAFGTVIKPASPITNDQVTALGQQVAQALIASNANGLTDADHTGVQSDVLNAIKKFFTGAVNA